MILSKEDLVVIKTCFLEKNWWDCDPLDYHFWDTIKRKVYEGQREPFSNLDELKNRIRKVWKRAYTVDGLRKAILQFRPRLKAVLLENGRPIKKHFE